MSGERVENADNAAPTPEEAFAAAKAAAKRLMRLARVGALATFDVASRAPLATLVGIASDWDGAPLFLMSELARHTQNLAGDLRASLLLTTPGPVRGDPLNQPRLTLSGPVERWPDASSRERYIRRNPKAKLYADFSDFAMRRMRVETVHFNGGFGRADRLATEDLLTPAGEVSALIAAEPALLSWVGQLGDATLARLASGVSAGARAWRAAGIDAEGLDLSARGVTARVDFSAPAYEPEAWRGRLQALLDSTAD